MSPCIEQRFIYVWSGNNFPYVNVLSVLSATKSHPDAEVLVYVFGADPKTVWFKYLEDIPQVSIIRTSPEELFAQLPQELQKVARTYEALSPSALSARSNILRYVLLYLFGGVYLDFDVFVLRPMDELLNRKAMVGEELVWADDEARLLGRRGIYLAPRNIVWAASHCLMWLDSHLMEGRLRLANLLRPTFGFWSRYQMNNAVIGAAPKNEFIEQLLLGAVEANTTVRYATGPTLIDKVVRLQKSDVDVRPADDFYAVPPGQSYRLFYDKCLTLPESAYLIHYAASNHPGFVSEFNPLQGVEFDKETVMGSILHGLSEEMRLLTSHQTRLLNHA